MAAVIGTAVSVFGYLIVAAIAFGLVRMLLHQAGPARGDSGLAAELGRLAGRRARRVAAMVVDLDAAPATRSAFIAADEDTRFEIGSVTKGLTGMLLSEAISRGEAGLDTPVAALLPETKGSRVGTSRAWTPPSLPGRLPSGSAQTGTRSGVTQSHRSGPSPNVQCVVI